MFDYTMFLTFVGSIVIMFHLIYKIHNIATHNIEKLKQDLENEKIILQSYIMNLKNLTESHESHNDRLIKIVNEFRKLEDKVQHIDDNTNFIYNKYITRN